MSLEESKKKKKKGRWTRVWFLLILLIPDWLFGLDRLLSPGERSVDRVAIHSSPIYARCHRASEITPGTRTFFFSFQDKCSSLHSSYYPSLHFPPAWDRLFLLNVALVELRSRRLTRSERLATPERLKVPPIWTFSCANAGRAHHQTSTVSFKQAEKKQQQSFKAMVGHESASEKYRKQCFLHDRTAGMPRTSCPGRNNTIGLLLDQRVAIWSINHWHNVRVIDRATGMKEPKVREAFAIEERKPAMNRDKGV